MSKTKRAFDAFARMAAGRTPFADVRKGAALPPSAKESVESPVPEPAVSVEQFEQTLLILADVLPRVQEELFHAAEHFSAAVLNLQNVGENPNSTVSGVRSVEEITGAKADTPALIAEGWASWHEKLKAMNLGSGAVFAAKSYESRAPVIAKLVEELTKEQAPSAEKPKTGPCPVPGAKCTPGDS